MNGARTTLEVRLVHCIGSVLDLEAVYTLMRSTSSVLVRDCGFNFSAFISWTAAAENSPSAENVDPRGFKLLDFKFSVFGKLTDYL